MEGADQESSFFFQTKMGVVTQKGDWFHITAEQVDEFAPGLLEHISFSQLIKEAQAWVESTSSLSLLLLYLLLFFTNPCLAATIAFGFHFFWYHYKSAFVINKIYKLFVVINHTVFLFIVALISLSILAMQQQFTALVIGLLFFLVMKPGVLRKAWEWLHAKRSTEGLPLNDRVLKMIIIKRALYTAGTSPRELAGMEERFAELVSKIKNRDNKK